MIKHKGVIAYHHPLKVFEDCKSINGHTGNDNKKCIECDNKEICILKRKIYFDNGVIVIIDKQSNLVKFSKYIMRLLSSGNRSNTVITELHEVDGVMSFKRADLLSEEEIEVMRHETDKIKEKIYKDFEFAASGEQNV